MVGDMRIVLGQVVLWRGGGSVVTHLLLLVYWIIINIRWLVKPVMVHTSHVFQEGVKFSLLLMPITYQDVVALLIYLANEVVEFFFESKVVHQ